MTVEIVKNTKLKEVCQYCKQHTNKPSYCKLYDKHVGRKETCEKFKRQ